MTSPTWNDRDEAIARLERLEEKHLRAQNCDNAYGYSGRWAAAEREMNALRREIQELGE